MKHPKEFIIRDGKRYENCKTIIEQFHINSGTTTLWNMRKNGLPYIEEEKNCYYNIDDFIAWHADKNYGNCPVGGEQDVS